MKGSGNEPPAFTGPAPVPAMPWLETPTRGMVAGQLTYASGRGLEGQTIRLRRTGWFRRTKRTTTDASGWFGMMSLKPGTYEVRLEDRAGKATGERTRVRVTAGAVARAALTTR